MKKKCAIVGDINIDIITPPFKLPDDESSCILDEFNISIGGNAINVAAALASLGAEHEFLGAIGDDSVSKVIIEKCQELKINTRLFTFKGHSAGITLALTYFGGRRQFIATLGTNKLLKIENIDKKRIFLCDHLHRGGFWYTPELLGTPTIYLMKSMISEGKQTSLDVGWDQAGFPQKNLEILYDTLEYTEFIFLNEKELKEITKKKRLNESIDEILQISTHIDDPKVIVHQGAKGSLIASRKTKIKISTGDIPQNNPTGTGDIYNAGFIFGLLNDWEYKKCGRFADKAACIHLMDKNKIYPSYYDVNSFSRNIF